MLQVFPLCTQCPMPHDASRSWGKPPRPRWLPHAPCPMPNAQCPVPSS
ncbi:MAG: hypothetical protein V7L05_10565 [Nostoc sp.]